MLSQGLTSLLWFVAILALIPIALWLLRRTPMGGSATQGVLRSIAVLPLSTSQRIVTVEVGHGAERRWLVLGLTPHSITALHTMPPGPDLPSTGPTLAGASGFAQMFARVRGGDGARDAR